MSSTGTVKGAPSYSGCAWSLPTAWSAQPRHPCPWRLQRNAGRRPRSPAYFDQYAGSRRPCPACVSRARNVATSPGRPLRRLAPLPRLRDPLEPLEIDERLRPAQDLRGTKADEEFLRGLESPHAHEARAHSLEDVGVGAGSHRQVVLAGETERLVVEPFEQEPGVVDLEHVDLGEMPMESPGVGDRV